MKDFVNNKNPFLYQSMIDLYFVYEFFRRSNGTHIHNEIRSSEMECAGHMALFLLLFILSLLTVALAPLHLLIYSSRVFEVK